mgnify:CR=1 FL=1
MSRRRVGSIVLTVVVAAGVVGALAVGLGPVDSIVGSVVDGTDADDDGGEVPEGESESTDSGHSHDSGSGGDAAEESASEFQFTVRNIDECGQTCRDVTVGLRNTMNASATDVTVTTQIYTGDEEIWSASESFTEVDASESKTRTKRVKLGYFDAVKVKQNGGEIRIETTVTWDGGEQSFTERRKVA